VSLNKAKGLTLLGCFMFSLFLSAYSVPRVGILEGGRDIQIYVVDAADSPNSFVGSTSAVRTGVQAAINDASNRTKVKLAGENINPPIWVSSASDLEYYLNNPPERAVFVNAHGEPVPMPNDRFSPYVSIDSPVDGAFLEGAVTVEATVKTLAGVGLEGLPYLLWGYAGDAGNPISMSLVDPVNCRYRATIQPYWSDKYEVRVVAKAACGLSVCAYEYFSYRGVPHEAGTGSGGGGIHRMRLCPYLYAWDGEAFAEDNNILLGLNESRLDYHKVERAPVQDADGNYLLGLRESADKRDFFDRVQLSAVDHEQDVGIAVDSNGSVSTYRSPRSPWSAMAHCERCGQVVYELGVVDDCGFYFAGGDWVDLDFGCVNASSGAKLVLHMRCGDGGVVGVQRFDSSSGVWETVASVQPRRCLGLSVVDVSEWFSGIVNDCRVRLLFNCSCYVDYTGFDTSAEASVTLQQGELVSAYDSSGINATYGDLLFEDGVCAELDHGYDIDLRFRLPELNGSGLERDFIFVAEGYYVENAGQGLGGMGAGGGAGGVGCPVDMKANWRGWFDLIENRCRTMGWIWANVAGYSFHYFGNNGYWSLMGQGYDQRKQNDTRQPRRDGLKEYLDKNVECNNSGGPIAKLGFDYTERSGFWDTYPGLDYHRNVGASRPFLKGTELPWNMFFYKDQEVDAWSSATIAMNKTVLGDTCDPGVFVHNGFSEDVDMDGMPNTYADDWFKGYVATALAVEEARAFITVPTLQQIVWTQGFPKHTACFGAALRAADRGEQYDPVAGDFYRYVRLLLTTGAHFKRTGGYYLEMYGAYYLSVADISLRRASNVSYVIDEYKSGCELGAKPSIMNDVFWYGISVTAGFIPQVGVFLGPALDLLPILVASFQPASKVLSGEEAYANGTRINPCEQGLDRGKGTIGFFVETRFYKHTGGVRTYTFTYGMASWIGWIGLCDVPYVLFIPYTTQLSFEANWTI